MMQEIIEALESTAPSRADRYISKSANTSKRAITNYRDYLMRFLTELDAGLTVGEIRDVLDQYD